jgi:hypothetical protein
VKNLAVDSIPYLYQKLDGEGFENAGYWMLNTSQIEDAQEHQLQCAKNIAVKRMYPINQPQEMKRSSILFSMATSGMKC